MVDSIREALTAAMAEKPADEAPVTEAVEAPVSTSVANDSVTSSDATETPLADEATGSNDAVAATATPATPVAPAPVATIETPAPASWSNEERAAWSTVPESARKAVLRREGEMNRALQESSAARRRVQGIDEIAAPYKPLLDKYGVTVEQTLPNLLATRAALEVGTPEQKAMLVANICAEFGIDVALLDGELSTRYANGQPVPQRQAQAMPDVNALVDQRLNDHPLIVQYKAAQQERAQAAIAAVSADPHYDTVRFTMADLIDKAKEQGRSLDLPSALRIAKQFHGIEVPPPSSSVSDAARTLAAARNAASSVSGAPKPTAARKPGEGSLREELEANLAAQR